MNGLNSDFGNGIGLLGSGGQSRELAGYCDRTIVFRAVERAFLGNDNDVVALEDAPVHYLELDVVLAVGAPGLKRNLSLKWGGVRFATIVARDSSVADDVELGKGSIVAPGARVMAGSIIGSHVLINTGTVLSHDCVVGDFSTLSPGVTIGGACVLGAGVFIGIGATVSNGVSIGTGAVVGAGAVVLQDVGPNEVVVGVPARTLRVESDWLCQI